MTRSLKSIDTFPYITEYLLLSQLRYSWNTNGNWESEKRIILFATSGSSGFEHSLDDLKKSAGNAAVEEGVVIHGKKSVDEWKKLLEKLGK